MPELPASPTNRDVQRGWPNQVGITDTMKINGAGSAQYERKRGDTTASPALSRRPACNH